MVKSAGIRVVSGKVVFYKDLSVAFVLESWEKREIWKVLIDVFLVSSGIVDN